MLTGRSTTASGTGSHAAHTKPRPKPAPALKRYGALFIDEWAKYPLDWVGASETIHHESRTWSAG